MIITPTAEGNMQHIFSGHKMNWVNYKIIIKEIGDIREISSNKKEDLQEKMVVSHIILHTI